MSDDMLSQDEIDALLNIGDDGSEHVETDKQETGQTEQLSTLQIDTLGEIGNISFGSSATTLSTLLNQKVEITTPTVSLTNKEELDHSFNTEQVCLQVHYTEGFSGKSIFVIKSRDAAIISDIMLGGDGTNPDETLTDIHLSAVQEAMNQMMGAAATSMSTVFDERIDISPPDIKVIEAEHAEKQDDIIEDAAHVKVSFQLKVGELIDSNIMQLIPVTFAKELVDQLLNEPESEGTIEQASVDEQLKQVEHSEANALSSEAPEQEPTLSMRTENQADRKANYYGEKAAEEDTANAQQANFSEFTPVDLSRNEQRNLDMLLDIPLDVTVELGRTKRSIGDILDLSIGSILELDKLAGEPVDIFVNEKLIAKGEVVVIDENFGVRVTDVISQSARLMNLK